MSSALAIDNVTIFWIEFLISGLVYATIMAWYVWPKLTKLSLNSALAGLLWVHVPRYIGMTLLVVGMIDPKLPREYLASAGYGDLLTAALALVSIFALRRNWRYSILMVWVTNIVGFADMLEGGNSLTTLNVPSFNLGTIWYLFTFYAPLVLISHLMIFFVLIKSKSWKK